jgi:hypothetical protein
MMAAVLITVVDDLEQKKEDGSKERRAKQKKGVCSIQNGLAPGLYPVGSARVLWDGFGKDRKNERAEIPSSER